MAKQKTNVQKPLSPEKYIKEKVRMLPVAHCYMSRNWEEVGECNVLVVRRHPQGTFTLGFYMVDTFCLGVKDSFYKFSLPETEFEDFMWQAQIYDLMDEVPYEKAHNLIYGAVAFAEEAGIEPDKSFHLTQYLLEEDTDEVPLIDYEFGKNGQHYLVANSRLEASRYLPLLEKNVGADFQYIIADGDDMDDEEEEDTDWMGDYSDMMEDAQDLPDTEYTYQHPAYPDKLDLKYPEIYELFADPKNVDRLKKADIDRLLALPHDALRQDVEQILLYETGRTCDGISEEQWKGDCTGVLMHGLFFLGEVGNEESLKVVLETLCQNEQYFNFYVGDTGGDIYTSTLYLLGKDRLNVLMDYIRKPGLYTFARVHVFSAVAFIARMDAARRDEVIEWFRQVLKFYTEQLPETVYCDGCLAGMLLGSLMEIKAEELLPEVEALFATGCVDIFCCGDWEDVKDGIMKKAPAYAENYVLDIYRRYQEYYKKWGGK